MFVDFFGCCMDQIFDQGAKLRYMFGGKASCPLVIRTMIGAGVKRGRPALRLPLLRLHAHAGHQVRRAVDAGRRQGAAALRRSATTTWCSFFENKVLYGMKGEVPEGDEGIPLGKADIKRAGGDVTIVAISRMVQQALEAAESWRRRASRSRWSIPRTLSPLDEDTILESVRRRIGW